MNSDDLTNKKQYLNQDELQRFSFDELDIRGELVYLDEAWQQVLARHDYPPAVRKQLGEALAIAALLSVTIKYDGNLILQIQSQGPLRSVVAQVTSTGTIRGLARWDGDVPEGSLEEVFGKGNIIISVIKDSGERYQSIVALEGQQLADALKIYFMQSEQLPSSFRLFVTPERIAGLFLQALPEARLKGDAVQREENWERINILADTVQPSEILQLESARLLHNLFHEEELRVYDPATLKFECTCSREKVETTLLTFGKAELEDILKQEGSIKVDCEFCNIQYTFNPQDIATLCQDADDLPPGAIVH